MFQDELSTADPAVSQALADERRRQETTLSMIASENHASPAVMEAQGSVLTNKYAEGYPGSRYYGGCEHVDEVERLAIERARELWGGDHINVQPHSGTQANMAVYFSALEPGDRILSLSLSHGGHLSHGHHVNVSGQLYEVEQYEVDPETGRIDYDAVRERAEAFDPDLVVSGSSAYPREFDFDHIDGIARSVDALHLADIAHVTGLVATGLHDNPVGTADFVTGSTHKTIRAGRGGIVICEETHADDLDSAVFPGSQGGPLMHNIAGKAVGFGQARSEDFAAYAERVVENASVLASELRERDVSLVSGGTDKHFVLVDLRESHPELTGADAETALNDVGIVVNKNTVPGETRSPFVTSGVRIGTPAVTTRGFGPAEMTEVAETVVALLDAPDDPSVAADARATVERLCSEHPVYE
nr:serine hydroxymethyltransferase [Haloglomus sp. DT116]